MVGVCKKLRGNKERRVRSCRLGARQCKFDEVRDIRVSWGCGRSLWIEKGEEVVEIW
jgi:hypothetical protein